MNLNVGAVGCCMDGSTMYHPRQTQELPNAIVFGCCERANKTPSLCRALETTGRCHASLLLWFTTLG